MGLYRRQDKILALLTPVIIRYPAIFVKSRRRAAYHLLATPMPLGNLDTRFVVVSLGGILGIRGVLLSTGSHSRRPQTGKPCRSLTTRIPYSDHRRDSSARQ